MDIIDYDLFGDSKFWWFEGKSDFIVSLVKKLNAARESKIMDIGCGSGDLLRPLKETGICYGLDINLDVLKIAQKESGNLMLADTGRISAKSGVFDIVIVTDVLEHVENDAAALSEIARVTKNHGYILLGVPAFSFMFSSHDIALKHYRRYDYEKLKGLVQKCGLTIRYKTYWNSALFLPLMAVRLLKKLFGIKPALKKRKFPDFLNSVLKKTILFENRLIEKGVQLPFGTSLYLILEKNEKN